MAESQTYAASQEGTIIPLFFPSIKGLFHPAFITSASSAALKGLLIAEVCGVIDKLKSALINSLKLFSQSTKKSKTMKKSTLMMTLIAVFTAICFPFASKAQRTISGISVVFNTTNDDKDNDTYLECQVLTPDNHWLATNAGQFGRFPDNSQYTLNLNLGSPYYSENLLRQSALYVHIIPNGDDSWNFAWTVIVNYTDGSQSRSSGTGGLNERSNAFRLVIF